MKQRPAMEAGASRDLEISRHCTGLALRRRASRRLERLQCGCSDRWLCRCSDPDPSEKQLTAAAQAARHLLAAGLPPLMPIDTIRRLWPCDRELSVTLARLRGVA